MELLDKPTLLFTWLVLCFFLAAFFFVSTKVAQRLPSTSGKTKLHLLVTSFMVSLLLSEGILRVLGIAETHMERRTGRYEFLRHNSFRDTFHVHLPNSSHVLGDGNHFAYVRTTNSIGVSSHDWTKEKQDSVYRIFALGDSFTEGDGAPADSTWPALLEKKLASNHNKVEVLNAGVCGSDPYFEFMLLKKRLLGYQPDKVIIAISIQDLVEDIGVRGGLERFDPKQGRLPKPFEILYAYSHISRLVYHKVFGFSWVLIREQDPEFLDVLVNDYIPRLFESYATLKEHVDLCFVLYPHKHEFVSGYRNQLEEALKIHSETNGIPLYDLRDCYKNQILESGRKHEEFWWKHDGHHNSDGYEVMAKCIENKIEW